MTTCEQAQALMAERLAGEIDDRDRKDLDAHLVDCRTCRADFALARAGAKADWPDELVPARLRNIDVARIEPRTIRFLRYATSAAAALCFGLLVATSARQEPLWPIGMARTPRTRITMAFKTCSPTSGSRSPASLPATQRLASPASCSTAHRSKDATPSRHRPPRANAASASSWCCCWLR